MILDFPGGAKPLSRTGCGKKEIEIYNNCSAICLPADDNPVVAATAGKSVLRGSLLGVNGGTPVYSSISGVFKGILEIEGHRYFTVISSGENVEEALFEPEERALTEMTPNDIIDSARQFSVFDSRSGKPLWKMLADAVGGCKRLVIDCTEPDAASAINYRLCIEKAKSIVGGAKIILHAIGAPKCVFAAEYYRNAAFDSLASYANDEKLFAFGRLEEKYPYGDRAIMSALYLKSLARGEDALGYGILIIGAEAAAAIYDAMVSGMPQLDRYISLCGEGVGSEANVRVPRGITVHDLCGFCGGISKGYFFVENSLLNGDTAKGVLCDKVQCLVSAKDEKKVQTECISCGRCFEVCPVRLMPNEILADKNRKIAELCVDCGACEFICPSGIPLRSIIRRK